MGCFQFPRERDGTRCIFNLKDTKIKESSPFGGYEQKMWKRGAFEEELLQNKNELERPQNI